MRIWRIWDGEEYGINYMSPEGEGYGDQIVYAMMIAYSRAEVSTRVFLKGAFLDGMSAVEYATDLIDTFAEDYGDEPEVIY